MAKTFDTDTIDSKINGFAESRGFSNENRRAGQDLGTPGTQPVREKTDDARQAETPHTVRYMLAIGLAGVVVAFAIIYFIFVAA